ncbi:MAG: orotate phosphoribosyltransferase [Bacteroidales bacterium]|jgi:orotate phosphoribosyltransferase|nr:orotate phosphoribosyltransferase [Bacteroidales bacterium]HOL98748.1 orotate phosphoribosyltransferase [Bacteroidales bacterium]HOM36189.1 orotate phosphoribosyltransferase [Bacteroidales bacterium]HPD23505.1 orotate phosphoribosyltransferase [Bacteroidales bacterium]HRS99637.1 orotate phosphoribosyltransferase [Bacteroidales bacterium]
MDNTAKQIAEKLLQIKAIKLEPTNHFTWASGWFSPIYCDNRKTLSYPEVRTFIKDSFVKVIKENFKDFDVIAGVATGAIAQGALVADALKKPFVYIRSQAKDHGLGNQIEGKLDAGQKVLIIEDLISTGGSSLSAAEAVRNAGCEVVGMVAIFTYNFQKSVDAFNEANVKLITLSNYNILIEQALETGYITNDEVELLNQWRIAPDKWKKE